ncbi:MAG: type I glyceraldehyde-3-phosphate dehydrogenase [Flavobacterium sp.]
MQKIPIGINGFGRIGRTLLRQSLKRENIQVVAINDIAPIETMKHLLQYDSIHGVLHEEVLVDNNFLVIGNQRIKYTQWQHPEDISWEDVEIVIESTGKFKTMESANFHLKNDVKKVIISAPASDEKIPTVVLGVNERKLTHEHHIISNASCTTNNAAPMLQLIQDNCQIESAYITTVHSYTTDQSLHDQPHADLRRARGAAQSIVPTTTGAAKALTKIFPELDQKIGGSGIRVPVPNGSLTDITCYVKHPKSPEEINQLFAEAAKNQLNGILAYTNDPIVSVDVIGNPHSCLFDASLTSVIGNMVKIVGWYDNETGYSNRLLDLIAYLKVNQYI